MSQNGTQQWSKIKVFYVKKRKKGAKRAPSVHWESISSGLGAPKRRKFRKPYPFGTHGRSKKVFGMACGSHFNDFGMLLEGSGWILRCLRHDSQRWLMIFHFFRCHIYDFWWTRISHKLKDQCILDTFPYGAFSFIFLDWYLWFISVQKVLNYFWPISLGSLSSRWGDPATRILCVVCVCRY